MTNSNQENYGQSSPNLGPKNFPINRGRPPTKNKTDLKTPEGRREYQRQYYRANKEKCQEYQRQYNLTHKKNKAVEIEDQNLMHHENL